MSCFDPLGRASLATVGAAIPCGAIIGLERQLRGRPTGIRMGILTCLGSAVFIHLGPSGAGGTGDPTRVLGRLVTGVSFPGTAVVFSREGSVTGVTTAAVI